MKEDTRRIKDSNKTLTPADKTSNMYRLSKEEYRQQRTNAVTAKYKKASNKIKENVDKTGLTSKNYYGPAHIMNIYNVYVL